MRVQRAMVEGSGAGWIATVESEVENQPLDMMDVIDLHAAVDAAGYELDQRAEMDDMLLDQIQANILRLEEARYGRPGYDAIFGTAGADQ